MSNPCAAFAASRFSLFLPRPTAVKAARPATPPTPFAKVGAALTAN